MRNGFGETDAMPRTVVRKYEFRGRDAYDHVIMPAVTSL